jgi:hypothetical protein
MLMTVLAYSNIFLTELSKIWKHMKFTIVYCLGNNPTNYYLLHDGRVLPDSMSLPEYEVQTAYIYNSDTHTICKANDPFPQGRFRSLPYLSITFQNTYIQQVDISDWLGEIRANPVPNDIHVKQILTLWSLATNRYIPEGEGTTIHVVDSDANETIIR